MSKRKSLFVVLFIIYCLVFSVALLNPMQSDDFSFYLMGLSVKSHFTLYMTWSGRVIADYLSSLLLGINNHFIIAFVSSWALPILLYTVANIPYYKETNKQHLGLVVALLFVVYWLSNPALGQTTFWVVGQCNYLWPLVFVALFIKYLLECLYRETLTLRHFLVISVLAFLAGFSNEATGAVVVYFVAALFVWALHNRVLNKKLIIISLCFVLIGYALLMLAPGNFMRAAHPDFVAWRAMGLSERVYNHFLRTMPHILLSYGIIYVVLLWAFCQGYKKGDTDRWLIVIFFIGILVFGCILIASPGAGQPRTYITGLFFLLIALSFLLKEALNPLTEVSKLAIFLLIGLGSCFVFSYSCVVRTYYALYEQSKIRIEIIEQQKAKGAKEVTIPNYFGRFVVRQGDYPEIFYHSSGGMAAYYGISTVALTFVDFDYGKFWYKPCQFPISKNNQWVRCIDVDNVFLSNNTTLIIKFDPKIKTVARYSTRVRIRVANGFAKGNDDHYEITLPLRIVHIGDDLWGAIHLANGLLQWTDNTKIEVSILLDAANGSAGTTLGTWMLDKKVF